MHEHDDTEPDRPLLAEILTRAAVARAALEEVVGSRRFSLNRLALGLAAAKRAAVLLEAAGDGEVLPTPEVLSAAEQLLRTTLRTVLFLEHAEWSLRRRQQCADCDEPDVVLDRVLVLARRARIANELLHRGLTAAYRHALTQPSQPPPAPADVEQNVEQSALASEREHRTWTEPSMALA